MNLGFVASSSALLQMTRRDLQYLSRLRIREARHLIRGKHFAGAYYLSGYAVECALKAAIARKVMRYDFPDKKLAGEAWVHDLPKLLKVAGLERQLQDEFLSSPSLEVNWTIIKDWSVESRYDPKITEPTARSMFLAASSRGGILPWLKKKW